MVYYDTITNGHYVQNAVFPSLELIRYKNNESRRLFVALCVYRGRFLVFVAHL
jgi:hypothetical protein